VVQPLVDSAQPPGRRLLVRLSRILGGNNLSLLLQQALALDVAAEDVLEDGAVIGLGLLLDLQDVHVLGELLDLLAGNGVDQGGLSDAVATDEPVLPPLDEL
jgi:hypothetical protein